jgi:hypothetical protein
MKLTLCRGKIFDSKIFSSSSMKESEVGTWSPSFYGAVILSLTYSRTLSMSNPSLVSFSLGILR